MRATNFIHTVTGNLTERKGRTIGAILVLAFTAAVLLASAAVGLGFLRGMVRKAGEMFPPTQLLIKPKTVSMGMLSFNAVFLDLETVAKVKAIPGVSKVSPQLALKIPLRLEADIVGQSVSTDGVIVGIEPELMAPDVDQRFPFAYDEASSQPIPAVVPRFVLDLYNLGYADSVGLPKINMDYLLGKRFTLHAGQAMYTSGPADKKQAFLCRVVGLSSNSSLVTGVYIPLRHAEELNKWYTGNDTTQYTALQVTVANTDYLDDVTSSIQSLNLLVEGNRETYQTIKVAAYTGGAVIAGFSLLVLAIAVVCIVNMFGLILMQRSGDVTLLRAIGATKKQLLALYATEFGFIGITGALLGLAIMGPALHQTNTWLLNRLPKLSILPDKLFVVSWVWITAIALMLTVLAIISALPGLLSNFRKSASRIETA